MKIYREINGTKFDIELTNEELSMAHKEFVTDFMYNTLINDFEFQNNTETAEKLAEKAYQEYCKGEGLTEYECIEKIFEIYKEERILELEKEIKEQEDRISCCAYGTSDLFYLTGLEHELERLKNH